MSPAALVALLLAGFAAGVINTMAGGGSLLTLPALIFAGLPVDVANGTNRIGVLLQSLVSVREFAKEDTYTPPRPWLSLGASVLGALVGALTAVSLDTSMLKQAVGVMLLVVGPIVVFKPDLTGGDGAKSPWLRGLVFFVCGWYGGFVQAGVGVLLLSALVLAESMDLVRANAWKLLFVLVFTVPALAVFLIDDLVRWVPALVLSVGTMAGARVGTRWTISGGASVVRWVVLAMVVISGSKLLGIW